MGLLFITRDAGRDARYVENHLLFYLAQDLVQSAVSIVVLALESLHTAAKRELRFILEVSVMRKR
jgi:hypothetical protein